MTIELIFITLLIIVILLLAKGIDNKKIEIELLRDDNNLLLQELTNCTTALKSANDIIEQLHSTTIKQNDYIQDISHRHINLLKQVENDIIEQLSKEQFKGEDK